MNDPRMGLAGLLNFRILSLLAIFMVLGFFASMAPYLAWLAAPVFGWYFWERNPNYLFLGLAALGLLLGGVPMCLVLAINMIPLAMVLALLVGTPFVFLGGATLKQIITVIRQDSE